MPILETVFGWVCHQLPGRSPQAGDLIFPLCYRCAGLYLGLFAGYAGLTLPRRWKRRAPSNRRLIALGLLMVPFLLDGWANTLALWDSPDWMRASTGAAAGVMLATILWPAAFRGEGPAVGRLTELSAALAASAGLLVLLEGAASAPLYTILAAAATAGLGMFAANLALLLSGSGRAADVLRRMRSCVRIPYRTPSRN